MVTFYKKGYSKDHVVLPLSITNPLPKSLKPVYILGSLVFFNYHMMILNFLNILFPLDHWESQSTSWCDRTTTPLENLGLSPITCVYSLNFCSFDCYVMWQLIFALHSCCLCELFTLHENPTKTLDPNLSLFMIR